MDVIGNNIANVNTTGYKTSRVIFQDIFSQTAAGGTASTPALGIGGTNPVQIGLGVILSSIDVMHTPAPTQRTDNPFDMMIGGDGFFIVEGPEGYFYTRAGNFKVDDEGYLVTTDGYFVLGFSAYPRLEYLNDIDRITGEEIPDTESWKVNVDKIFDENGNMITVSIEDGKVVIGEEGDSPRPLERIRLKAFNIDYDELDPPDDWDPDDDGPIFDSLEGFSIGKNGEITIIANNRKLTIAMVSVAMFANPGGLEKAGNSLYRETSSSGQAEIGLAYQNGAGQIIGGGLEMSNVDLATEFTDMIVTQRGFQANSRVITVSDTMLEELVNLKR